MRHTIRLLLKSPGFTITAVLILGFGIGANTAVFSLINSVPLKPVPYPHPDQLMAVFMPVHNNDVMGFDYPISRTYPQLSIRLRSWLYAVEMRSISPTKEKLNALKLSSPRRVCSS
jgi:hypothetical protein